MIISIDYIDFYIECLIILIVLIHTSFNVSGRKLSSKKPDEVQTDPLAIFHTAMENAQPVVGVQPIKKAGKTYQVRQSQVMVHRNGHIGLFQNSEMLTLVSEARKFNYSHPMQDY